MTAFIDAAGGAEAIATRLAASAAVAGVIGVAAFRLVVARRDHALALAAAARAGMAAALLLLVAGAVRIYLQAAAFAGPDEPPTTMLGPVLGTTWGRAALMQLAGAIVGMVAWAGAPGWRRASWGYVAALLAAGAAPFMGHAAAFERYTSALVAADAIHVLAVGGWTGGLVALLLGLAATAPGAGGPERAATLIDRFGPLAMASVSLLAATGAAAALMQLREPMALVSSDYGRLLVVKLVLVAAAAALGRRHSRRAAADVRAGKAGAVARSFGIELLAMLAVLIVTAVLTGSPPPGE